MANTKKLWLLKKLKKNYGLNKLWIPLTIEFST